MRVVTHTTARNTALCSQYVRSQLKPVMATPLSPIVLLPLLLVRVFDERPHAFEVAG